MTPQERDETVHLARLYIAGDQSEAAEDAYFEIESIAVRDAHVGMPLVVEVASGLTGRGDRAALGAGLLESFIRAHGQQHAEMLTDGITGSAALLEALRTVNEMAIPPALRLKLPGV